MRYRALLFDLDGTLLDSVPVILRSARETFEAMGLPFDEPGLRKAIGLPLKVQARQFAGERAVEFVDRYWVIYRANQDRDAHLFPGTIQMLDAVKARGCLTALVTSKAARPTERVLEITGLDGRFDAVITADDVTVHKPHPEPILKALEALKVAPEEAVYVGDSLFDVDAARQAGVVAAAVSWGARSREDLIVECADRVFDTWQGFLDWLEAG